jgi:predicted Zn-dependent peptidase
MKHTVNEIVLDNGARGLLINIPDASVLTLEINFRAGEYLLQRQKWETAHLMEHILLGANELYPKARDFQAEVERNGAYSNASTGVYDITYEAECADFEWDRILGLVILAITKPLFLESEFKAEFGNVREELTARSNNHFRYLGLALREKYGLCAMTDQERLIHMDNVKLEDVKAHYAATHTTSNMCFVIAGNLDQKRQKTITNILNNMELPKGTGREPLPKEVPETLKKPLYIEVPAVENMYFYMDTFMKRWIRNDEIDALSLANNMLTETFYSRILGAAREQGLVYGMSSSYTRWADGSNWWFGAQIRPENIPKLFDIMTREIMAIREGKISDEDIINAKQYALGRYQRSAQTVAGTASGYSNRYFFDNVIEDYYELPKRIESVTKPAILDISNAFFTDDIKGFGVLGTCGQEFTDKAFAHLHSLWNK